ncbi:enoyl-CoA hydratase family protein [Mycobacterium kansasii]|uniref:enoyl-CoA hydratase family protein n=1 Tax=Mycobacterium kansasii TaxID=1768 RepID=UPI0007B5024C|nr:enoyl-CoA hydratase family protein [Mycobacterium kansasii]ARG70944.1 enoyl-CoA hydratase [Mycobacterium kansasii]ARG74497.1 enoyl-CoA hydratase [Mycobacterium kansasii]ARG79957.1 enoyl-CoA hydratase [Mycobacterium kansasii]ARG92071.1 enoyl-CoA hydratase [Mycobacterium kansasii]KZS79981.1 enoyl-CoA hydratase [Mycobacterium kansasii]
MDALVEYAGPDECGGPLARLTLNSPHNRNALSSVLVSQLHQGLRDAAADPAVRVVVLTHTGGTFCAGADLSEAGGGDPRGDRERGAAGRSGSPPSAGGDRERGAAGRSGSPPSAYDMAVARAREMTTVLRAIVESPRPVIGAVNGHVRAGGFGLVGACDIVVAGPRSTFALTEARIGVAPAIISLTLLPKLSPRAAARYYLTGETFGASEAAEIGLVTMAADDVDAAVAKLVAEVGRGSPQGLAASKALTTPAVLEGFDRDAQRLAEESARLFVSEEAREGMLAFLQKRPPSWVKADPASR